MIQVFKTNVQEIDQSIFIVGKLLEHFPNRYINFDLEDCDKIFGFILQQFQIKKMVKFLMRVINVSAL